jgi:hypothetical protein
MEFQEDSFDSVIEEIAGILATGYLRLRKAQTLKESAAPLASQKTGERLNSMRSPSPRSLTSLNLHEKRDQS